MSSNKPIRIMEVCGTHTVSIAKSGLKTLLKDDIELISGPGCPVCVTSHENIDRIISISENPATIITSFGDVFKVNGEKGNFSKARENGADIRVIYSPFDVIEIAESNKNKKIVLFSVGFETTIPAFAYTLSKLIERDIRNVKLYPCFKLISPALRYILSIPDLKIDGFLLPGHVSVIIGSEPYEFLVQEFATSGVISGFEPEEILSSIEILKQLIKENSPKIVNNYKSFVKEKGNIKAKLLIDKYFDLTKDVWRGIDLIENSALTLKDEFKMYDAETYFDLPEKSYKVIYDKNCQCGQVLIGKIQPDQCLLFGKTCNPSNPIGPCMVSQEGSCAAFYRYRRIKENG